MAKPAIMNSLIAVDVASWTADDEHPYFPEGSRDKQLLRCPDPSPHAILVPNHRYQFKESRRVYPEQFWAEVVAYRIGLLAGVPVPPAYAAWDSRTRVCGALIEWFYGYLDRPLQRYQSGGLLMKSAIPDYDLKRGRQHNFRQIETICGVWAKAGAHNSVALQPDWIDVWAAMLTFDALIGNTDRHQDNWGFIIDQRRTPGKPNVWLAPAFDNGTSLGHERPADQFGRFSDQRYLEGYLAKGRHHLRWQLHDEQQAAHCDLLLMLVERHPSSLERMLKLLDFNADTLEHDLGELTRLPVPVPLSPDRGRFMLHLTLARRTRILKALNP